jgi:MOSC domain
MEDLNSRMEKPLSIIRFRPNIVLKGGQPFDEDKWAEISIGEAGKFWLLSRSPRYPPLFIGVDIDVNFPMLMLILELKIKHFLIKHW